MTFEAIRERAQAEWDVRPPGGRGLTVVEMMDAAFDGGLQVLYIMGENSVISDPNVNHVREVLQKVDFLVAQDIFLSDTAELADVVLPAVSFAEKTGSFTNTERRVQLLRRALDPPGEARDDARQEGIADGETVEIASRRGTIRATAVLTERIAAGQVFVPFHFREAPANALTNDALVPVAKIPEFKVCAVKLARRAEGATAGATAARR